jgi:uncharacterized protein involved in exopolysaccharide biosynthesis
VTENRLISRRNIVVIAIVGLAFAVAAWVGSQFMQRAYMSTISMLSALEDTDNSLTRVTNQLGAVAGLLGVGGSSGRRDINESLATLRSRLLVAELIQTEGLLDDIVAILGSEELAELSDDDRLQAAVTYFQTNILGVSYDVRSSLVVVTITWVDRHRAAELANAYVALANEAMRERGIASARNRLQFLHEAAKNAATVELRTAIYRLVETQVNAEMMAATKPDYAFTVVDPAVPAGVDEFVRPQTWLLVLMAAMFGGALALGGLYILEYMSAPKARA